MFNLIISGNDTAWETDQYMRMEAERFGEYSEKNWDKNSLSDKEAIRVLSSLPTLLLYETCCTGPAAHVVRHGVIRDLKVVDRQMLFKFEEQGHFLKPTIADYADRLGIGRFELNRTHWAVKEGGIPSGILDQMFTTPFGSHLSEVTRQSIITYLLGRPGSFHGNLDLLQFLKRIWDLASMPSTDRRFENAEADIWQHTVNNDDYDHDFLLNEYLPLCKSHDKVFLRFVEMAIHPLVSTREEISQRVREINTLLKPDGYRLMEAFQVSSHPVYKANRVEHGTDSSLDIYEVVLSFAGEDRTYVEEVAEYLFTQGVEVFYDRNEKATLWGKDLAEHLDLVYRKSARFCIMFISKHYADKIWPNHERRAALARAIEERQEYILPARFDNTEVPGIRPSLGYVELSRKTPRELGKLILQKLGRQVPDTD